MDFMQLAILALVGTFLAVTVKKESPSIGLCVSLMTALLLLFAAAQTAAKIFYALETMATKASLSGQYIQVIVRVMAITYLARFAMDVCEEAGEKGIASQVDLAARLLIAASSIPVLLAVMQMVEELL